MHRVSVRKNPTLPISIDNTKGSMVMSYSRFFTSTILQLVLLISTCFTAFGQQCSAGCPPGQTQCLQYILDCTQCGFHVCSNNNNVGYSTGCASGGSGTSSCVTDTLDNCKAQIGLHCNVAKDNSGNSIVCGSGPQPSQCYQRNISTSGYKCSDGTLASYTSTVCCY